MKRVALFIATAMLLAGCAVSNETTEAIALKALGDGGKILYSEHTYEPGLAPSLHVFVGKDRDGVLHYIRIDGEKIAKNDPIDQR